MVKPGKWLRSFLTGKKERNQEKVIERKIWLQLPPPPPPPPSTPKEKRRRSFHFEAVKQNPKDQFAPSFFFEPELGRAAAKKSSFSTIQEVAAIKIQASFRSFLARKALRALKGLVKLQAVVRGFLVRKQAAVTLRSMQTLLTVQVRARAQRVRMIEEVHAMQWRESNQRRMMNESKFQQIQDMERNVDKNVEMEPGQSRANSKSRKSNPTTQTETKDRRVFSYQKSSLGPSPLADMSSGSRNTQFEEPSSFTTARSSPQYSSATSKPRRISSSEATAMQDGSYLMSQDCSLFPNYMANTESWKAKARSQSTPRQRNELFDSKQSGKERTSVDGRNVSRAAWISSSSTAAKEHIQWSGEFDRLVTNTGYYRFMAA